MKGEASPGLLVVIGAGFLLGAVVLAWLSSVETLHFTRTEAGVRVVRQSWLFGRVLIDETTLDDVRRIEAVRTIAQSSRSRPFTHLYFHTSSGTVELWSTEPTLFVGRASEMNDFVEDTARREATFSSLVDARETIRFAIAQVMTLFLALCGAGLIYVAARSIIGPDRSIGPVDV